MAKRHITNLEELVDLLMRNATGVSLMEFVAFHRQPGENFLNWEALAREQYRVTGRWVHRPSLRSWATAAGIPETKEPGRHGTVEDTLAFRKAVSEKVGVSVPTEAPARPTVDA